jgi:N-acetylglucosamine-6-phosphate deacetylase
MVTELPGHMTAQAGLITAGPGPAVSGDSIVAPGLIDLQINGGWGHDFTSDPGSIWEVGRRLPETGVTTFLPTIVSAPYRVAEAAIAVLASGPPEGYRGAEPLGLHIEGPWISPQWKGAHNEEYLRAPDPAVAREWAESGLVRMVTIAPELETAFETAEILDAAGVVVSAGHSGADFDTAADGLSGPWSAVTHLFNQMSPFHHRAPGLVGAALLSDRPCGLIADGVHVHPAAIRLVWEVLGPERLVLVTDAMAAAGLGVGTHRLGDLEVNVGPDGPRISGTLAGSTLALGAAVENLARWADTDNPPLNSASAIPAALVGATDRGRLDPGMRADVVVLDRLLQVKETWVAGEPAYRAEDP